MPKFKLTVKGVTTTVTISVTAAKFNVSGPGISFADETNTLVGWVPKETLICVIDEEALK